MRILLAGEGYHILEAENGLRALYLYRGQTLVYSSFAPKGGIPEKTERDPGDRVAFYEWSPGYTLNFADGEAEALLYYNGLNDYYSTGCDILNMLCLLWWFLDFFLFNSRKIIRYILQLSEEIQAMEGGDLEHPITVRGRDEMTTLASCLDSMRLTLRQQQEEEAQASAKVKSRSPSWWKRCSSGALPARWNWGRRTSCSRSTASMCAAFWITSLPTCSSTPTRRAWSRCGSCRKTARLACVLKTGCCPFPRRQRAPRWA